MRGGGGARVAMPNRTNWDAPFILSPHLSTRIYFGSQFLYRSDNRGDNWTRISPDLSRNLSRDTLPIMGKVWPRGIGRAQRIDDGAQQHRHDR